MSSRSLRRQIAAPLSPNSQRAIAYGANVFSSQISRHTREAKAFARWAMEYSGAFQLGLGEAEEDDWPPAVARSRPMTLTAWTSIGRALGANLTATPISCSLLDPRLDRLGQEMGWSGADAAILQVMLDYSISKPVEGLMDALSSAIGENSFLRLDVSHLAMLTGYSEATVTQSVANQGPLRSSGLLRLDGDFGIRVMGRLQSLLKEPNAPWETVRAALFGPPQPATLKLADFDHLGQDLTRTLAVLQGALAERAHGTFVILYGPPGTGKTELAKTLAAALEVPLFTVGETGDDDAEPSREERLSELRLAQRLLAKSEPALLLLDEAEDLFGQSFDLFGLFSHRQHAGSRNFVHRTLEIGSMPVIMTANSLDAFGDAVLRRALCCIEVKVPPPGVRAAMWQKAAIAEGVAVPAEEIARLGRQLPASPALAASAMRAARYGGGDSATALWAITSVLTAMKKGKALDTGGTPGKYDPTLISADIDLAGLADRLAAPGVGKNWSLLLSGVSGSGKSRYAHHLAERMGLEVLPKRGSDLLGMYVGQTEKAIAAAFEEAADAKALLLFDEVDSMLADRRGAQKTWEISQVNELLTWLEPGRLKVPFVATTNLIENLDPAAMRRFNFKAKFGWLRPDQVEEAFRRILGCEPPPAVRSLTSLCPADFALVREAAEFQGTLGDPQALLADLLREQRAKPGVSGPIGFKMAG